MKEEIQYSIGNAKDAAEGEKFSATALLAIAESSKESPEGEDLFSDMKNEFEKYSSCHKWDSKFLAVLHEFGEGAMRTIRDQMNHGMNFHEAVISTQEKLEQFDIYPYIQKFRAKWSGWNDCMENENEKNTRQIIVSSEERLEVTMLQGAEIEINHNG